MELGLRPSNISKVVGKCTKNDRKYAKFTGVIKFQRQPDTFRNA
jgi:hypothetical protein